MMFRILLFCTVTALLTAGDPPQMPPQMPMPNDYANSIQPRWLAKQVLDSRLLDGMESMAAWEVRNTMQAKGTLTLTSERKVEGASAIRLRSRTVGDTPLPNGRYFGFSSAYFKVNGENWEGSNRLSFWIYPDLPGFRVVSLVIIFHNEGAEPVPDVYGKMGHNYLILRNQEWNHVVWEIANLPRDKVTGVEFQYRLQGNEPGASDMVAFDIDKLELEKVNADHWEGWNVAPSEIAYSHSGYSLGSPKSAISSGLKAHEFQLIDVETGQPALSKPLRAVKTQVGEFQVMDFSEIREPGTYLVRAGGSATRPFRIGNDVWTSSLWKAINFFYVERCGYAIPGVHDSCHRDWMLSHGDKRIPVNGGWHDAGDLSQSFGNTAEATYAMFHLAERLGARREEPALRRRLIEEAMWGLDWVIKTSFGDGFRASFSTMDRWTNNIVGDFDDMNAQARNSAAANFTAAATEAIAARVLREADPTIAAYSLKKAVEDWNFALAGTAEGPREAGSITTAAHGVQAGVELWQATGERQYAGKAIELARTVLDSQRREFLPGLTYPLAGIFYTGPDKQRIFRADHNSQESIPVAALVRLCEAFPNHPDWMKWYSSVVLYSDYYQKPMAAFTQPYGMLANSVYGDDEYKNVRPGRGATPESYRAQVMNGVDVGGNHHVRLFPVWFEFRGNHGTALTQTKALTAAAQLRGNLDLIELAEQQLEWVVGRNPFVQSTMWGEGHDYAPQYSAMSGDIVGSLPVGIQTRGDRDIPYWPTENCHNWKEVWVVPVSRWIWIMRDLAGPALVNGFAAGGVRDAIEFREVKSGRITRVDPGSGASGFRAMLAEGEYQVSSGGSKKSVTLLPGGTYSLDFREGRFIEFRISHQTAAGGTVSIQVAVEGSGRHKVAIRADNLALTAPERQLDLKPGAPQTIAWQGKMTSVEAPWIALVIPDDDPAQRKEATGSTKGR
jgi:hypothetical protein